MPRCRPWIVLHRKAQQQCAHLMVQQRMHLFPWRPKPAILAHLFHGPRHHAEFVLVKRERSRQAFENRHKPPLPLGPVRGR